MRPGVSPVDLVRRLGGSGAEEGDREFWQVSQSGLKVIRGAQKTGTASNVVMWVEDPSQYAKEEDIFETLHVPFLPPAHRCA